MKWKRTIWGGVISTAVIGVGVFLVGRISSGEAFSLVNAMLPSTRFLCASVITATSTILALILTLISFSSTSERKISGHYYDQIKWIAKMSCIAFIASVILLLIVNLPLEKAPEKLNVWLWVIYYFILAYSALLGGVLVTIILMLYEAATNIILVVHPDSKSSIVISEDPTKCEEKRSGEDPGEDDS